MKSLRICMIVDKDARVGTNFREHFAAAGYEISGPFASCDSARAGIEIQRPDVAILSPSLDGGSEFARRLRSLGIPMGMHSRQQKALVSDEVAHYLSLAESALKLSLLATRSRASAVVH